MRHFVSTSALSAIAAVGLASFAGAAELPKNTQKMLKALKMDASVLKGLDKELAVPKAWIEGAKKEGTVKIWTTYRRKPWGKMERIFRERYPFIKVEHDRVNNTARRVIRPLTAFKQGRVLADVITGLSGSAHLFEAAGAFVDLRDLPSYNNVPTSLHHPKGVTAVGRIRYYCMSYNTKKVKKADLPKTWDDLVTSKRFANKKIGLVNRPNNWLLPIWKTKGDAWGNEFIDKLFAQKPQLRKEGQGAALVLVIAGEMEVAIPSAMNRVAEYIKKNAKTPIGHHCPEPVPFTISETGVMAKNPHMNAAKIYANWYLSKEGQLAQFWANDSTPSHQGMRDNRFVYWPESVTGKKMAKFSYDRPEVGKMVLKTWDAKWISIAGKPKGPVAFKGKVVSSKRGGRRIMIKVKGKDTLFRISGSRSQVSINGKAAERGNVKAGMICKGTYVPKGKDVEARKFDCK
jgi:iron(III) transport system substrate-binding protein